MSSDDEPTMTLIEPGSTAKPLYRTFQKANCEAGQRELHVMDFARLQADAFEGTVTSKGLHDRTVLLVGVELGNPRAGVLAHILDVESISVGSGCKVHLRSSELPQGPLIVKVSRHLAAVIDRVLYDTHDCSRSGTQCVYGYFSQS